MKNKKGFTLIEILIVLVVLVTVTTGVTIGIKEIQKKSEQKALRELYTMVETAADTYLNLNDDSRLELLNDEITEKCIRVYILQNAGLVKSDLDNPVTKKRVPGNLCVISYINEEGVIENYFDLDDNLETHKVTLKIVDGKNTSTENKSVYTKAIFNLALVNSKFILDGTCDGGATLKIDGSKVVVYGVKKDQTCTVNLKNKQNKVTVNVINGMSSPESMIVDYGKDASFTLSGSTGYHYESHECTGDDTGKTLGSFSNNNLVITNVTEPVTCKVTYSINKYNITINGVNGSVSPTNITTDYGSAVNIKLSPNTGYQVNGTTTNCTGGVIDTSKNVLVISNVAKNEQCSVTFAPIPYNVTLTVSGGAGSTSKNINYNSSGTFTGVSPSAGYTSAGATVSCNGGAKSSISGTTVTVSGVTKAQTCTVKFPVDKYTLKITAKNCTPTSASYEVNNGSNKDIHFTPNANMALKSYSCTNNQKITYKGNNQFTVNKLTANTTCTIEYTAVTKSFAYKSSAQTYKIPYTGYYDITAYGAQGSGSGGKGGKIVGRVKLTKGDVITVITGGNDGTNGGGAGLYKGGGSTIIKKGNANLIIAAGGGGGSAGTAGGNGNGAGGAAASPSASGTNGGPGTKGTNGGGGGSGYNYSYSCRCSDCYYGINTCEGGYVTTGCAQYEEKRVRCPNSSCHTACYGYGKDDTYYCDVYTNTCVSWNKYYDPCKSGSNTCSYGCDDCSRSYKSGNGGKSSVGNGVTAVQNTAGANKSNGKASLTYYKENL